MKQCFQKALGSLRRLIIDALLLLDFLLSLTLQLWAMAQTVTLGKLSLLSCRLPPSRLWQGPGDWTGSLSILCGFGPSLFCEWKWLSSGLGLSGVYGISLAAQGQCSGHRGWA